MSALETPSAIIKFPIQVMESNIYTYDEEMIFQAKLAWIRPLNQAALGLIELSEEAKNHVRRLNEICREYGYKPLDTDF